MSHRTKRERDTRCEFTHKRVSLSLFVCGEATDEIDRRSMSTDGELPVCICYKKERDEKGEATDEIDRRSMSTDGTLPIYDAQVGE